MGYLDSPVGMNERKSMLWPWRLWKTTMILKGNWSANRGFSDLFMWISSGKCMKVRWYQQKWTYNGKLETIGTLMAKTQSYWGTMGNPTSSLRGSPKRRIARRVAICFWHWGRRDDDFDDRRTRREGASKNWFVYIIYIYMYNNIYIYLLYHIYIYMLYIYIL